MFAMLGGDLPAPPRQPSRDASDPMAALDAVLALQTEAGLEVLSDGGMLRELDPVTRWQRTAERTDRMVCGIVPGPWTAAAMTGTADPSAAGDLEPTAGDLEAAAGATRSAIEGLLAAGCQVIRVDEPGLTALEADEGVRSRVLAAHDRALPEPGASHLMLALMGGDATAIGASALAGMRYASFLFDLLRGPDSWRVVAQLPAERGVVCGVVPTGEGAEVVKEAMVWAAHYAASTAGRGLDRVGLATAGDLGGLDWDVAAARVRLLGTAERIAADDSMDHLAMELDPRAVGMKSAAFGRNLPVPERRGRRRSDHDASPDEPQT